jgi:hypothetical protein
MDDRLSVSNSMNLIVNGAASGALLLVATKTLAMRRMDHVARGRLKTRGWESVVLLPTSAEGPACHWGRIFSASLRESPGCGAVLRPMQISSGENGTEPSSSGFSPCARLS